MQQYIEWWPLEETVDYLEEMVMLHIHYIIITCSVLIIIYDNTMHHCRIFKLSGR